MTEAMMRSLFVLLITAVGANAADKGVVVGKLEKPETVTAVYAIDRTWQDESINKPMPRQPIPAKFDATTGEFSLELPHDKVVDLIVDYRNGTRLEGVNLKVKRSDFIEEDPPITVADVEKLKPIVKKLSAFENEHEILAITGNVQYACVLVNRLKTSAFYGQQPGEVIWRLELLHFEKPEDAEYWVKDQDRVFTLYYRERLQRKVYDAKMLTFDQNLGGLVVTKEQPKVSLGTIPAPEAKAGLKLRNPPPPPAKE